jgi:hypothetical protein
MEIYILLTFRIVDEVISTQKLCNTAWDEKILMNSEFDEAVAYFKMLYHLSTGWTQENLHQYFR